MEGSFDAGGSEAALVLVRKGENLLRTREPDAPLEARRLFEEALRKDYRSRAAKLALKSLLWWQRRFEECASAAKGPGKGSAIVDQWKGFYRFLDDIGGIDADREVLRAIRYWVSAAAIEAFDYNALNPLQSGHWELQFKLGLCCKGLGDYKNALVFLDTAAGFKQDDIPLLFERADVKALASAEADGYADGDREARLIFREAFLAGSEEACVYSMESAFFCGLYRAVEERGYEREEILEWMPVWGTFLGMFPFKCVLSQIKLGKLKGQIFELENELKTEGGPGSPNVDRKLVPRLLNRYFWLLEHYEARPQREEPSQNGQTETEGYDRLVRETLLKIQWICSGTRSIPEQVTRSLYFAAFGQGGGYGG